MFLIGICGGSGSGKTTLALKLKKYFKSRKIGHLDCDSYYKDNSHLPLRERSKINFDHPRQIDFSLLYNDLKLLKNSKKIFIPKYSYKYHRRLRTRKTMYPKEIILLEGIHILHKKNILDLIDLSIFLDLDKKTRLERRIKRDKKERGRSKDEIIHAFNNKSEPMFKEFIEPKKTKTNLILSSKNIKLEKIITLVNNLY